MWTDGKGRMDAVLPSALPSEFLSSTSGTALSATEARFLRSPSNSAETPMVLVGSGFASVSTSNVTNYDDHVWANPETEASFRTKTEQREI